MSYASLLKNIQEVLSQPTGIAAIASLGIHGAIALIVPLMPVDSEPSSSAASLQSVPILELSQADQNRLPETPDTFPSQFSLQPQLPQQPQLQSPNLDNQTTTLPPLPPPVTVYRQSALPLNPTPSYQIPPNRNFSVPQRPPQHMAGRGSASSVPVPSARTTPAPAPAPTAPKVELGFDPSGFNAANQRFTPSTRSFDHSEVRVAGQSVPVAGLPKVTRSEMPDDLLNPPATTTATNPTPQRTQRTQRTQPSNDGNDAAQTGGNQEQLIARLQQTTPAKDDVVLRNESTPQMQGATPKTPELPLKKVNENQGLIAQLNSDEGLRTEIRQAYPNSQEKPVIRETIAANQPNLQGTVLGFLVVDPEGKVLDIKFQNESASTDLQSKAREYFSTRPLQGGEQISSYPFSLRFQSDGKTAETNQDQKPAASLKPLPELRITNEQESAPASVVLPQTSTTPKPNNNTLSSTLESGQKLIQQLRQVREEREGSSSES